jgi:hypothetical protein
MHGVGRSAGHGGSGHKSRGAHKTGDIHDAGLGRGLRHHEEDRARDHERRDRHFEEHRQAGKAEGKAIHAACSGANDGSGTPVNETGWFRHEIHKFEGKGKREQRHLRHELEHGRI